MNLKIGKRRRKGLNPDLHSARGQKSMQNQVKA